jgi:hypothetical protein
MDITDVFLPRPRANIVAQTFAENEQPLNSISCFTAVHFINAFAIARQRAGVKEN